MMDLKLSTSIAEFFQDRIAEAIRNQGVDATTPTECYLVSLLPTSRRRHLTTSRWRSSWPRAVQSPDERVRQLKDVGDTSLYVSGFFADSLQRKLVDVDYYIQMGGAAYSELGALLSRQPHSAVFGEVYDELGAKFPRFVDVFAEVSRGTMTQQPRPGAALRALAAHRLGVDGAAAAAPGRHSAQGRAAVMPAVLRALQGGLESMYRVETELDVCDFLVDGEERDAHQRRARAARAAADQAGRGGPASSGCSSTSARWRTWRCAIRGAGSTTTNLQRLPARRRRRQPLRLPRAPRAAGAAGLRGRARAAGRGRQVPGGAPGDVEPGGRAAGGSARAAVRPHPLRRRPVARGARALPAGQLGRRRLRRVARGALRRARARSTTCSARRAVLSQGVGGEARATSASSRRRTASRRAAWWRGASCRLGAAPLLRRRGRRRRRGSASRPWIGLVVAAARHASPAATAPSSRRYAHRQRLALGRRRRQQRRRGRPCATSATEQERRQQTPTASAGQSQRSGAARAARSRQPTAARRRPAVSCGGGPTGVPSARSSVRSTKMRRRAEPERVTSRPIHCTRPSQARSDESSVVTWLPSRSQGSSASTITPRSLRSRALARSGALQRRQVDTHVALAERCRLALLHDAAGCARRRRRRDRRSAPPCRRRRAGPPRRRRRAARSRRAG